VSIRPIQAKVLKGRAGGIFGFVRDTVSPIHSIACIHWQKTAAAAWFAQVANLSHPIPLDLVNRCTGEHNASRTRVVGQIENAVLCVFCTSASDWLPLHRHMVSDFERLFGLRIHRQRRQKGGG
jgi:hypothetical protein